MENFDFFSPKKVSKNLTARPPETYLKYLYGVLNIV